MWQEGKANEKRMKDNMANHKKRVERRRAYYESQLGDPHQLLRVIGSSMKLYPNAEQYHCQENIDNFMPMPSNPNVRIDRFDGRSLLDYLPDERVNGDWPQDELNFIEELNYERYHDLIEAERLNVSEKECLENVEEEWTKLLDRHKALVAMADDKKRQSKHHTYAYDYGTENHDSTNDESDLLNEADILQYVDDLTDKDKETLNDMSRKYGITNYIRLLRHAKRDRDDQLREIRRKQEGRDDTLTKSIRDNKESRRRSRHKRRHRGRARYDDELPGSSRYSNDTDSTNETSEEEISKSGVVIEFGSSESKAGWHSVNPAEDVKPTHYESDPLKTTEEKKKKKAETQPLTKPVERKLTPMEKLKIKTREGLARQIRKDREIEYRKEEERAMEHSQRHAGLQEVPFKSSILRPPIPVRPKVSSSNGQRYRSPSSSRSPSPHRDSKMKSRRRYRSPSASRSTSPKKSSRKRRHRSKSPKDRSSKQRYRSPSTSRSRSPTEPRQPAAT